MESESQITERQRSRVGDPDELRRVAAEKWGGAYVRERVKWKRWRRPLKVRKECGGKLRVVISQ